eukprot:Gb_32316 [translate_table: standard]
MKSVQEWFVSSDMIITLIKTTIAKLYVMITFLQIKGKQTERLAEQSSNLMGNNLLKGHSNDPNQNRELFNCFVFNLGRRSGLCGQHFAIKCKLLAHQSTPRFLCPGRINATAWQGLRRMDAALSPSLQIGHYPKSYRKKTQRLNNSITKKFRICGCVKKLSTLLQDIYNTRGCHCTGSDCFNIWRNYAQFDCFNNRRRKQKISSACDTADSRLTIDHSKDFS